MRAKISDPSRYENFGVRNILDLQYEERLKKVENAPSYHLYFPV